MSMMGTCHPILLLPLHSNIAGTASGIVVVITAALSASGAAAVVAAVGAPPPARAGCHAVQRDAEGGGQDRWVRLCTIAIALSLLFLVSSLLSC